MTVPITVPRREHTGAANPARLAGAINDSVLLVTADDLTGWPTGGVGVFIATIARGSPNEEKILCSTRSGDTLAIVARGWDGSGASDHDVGEILEHTDSATEFDEMNVHITSNVGAHGVSGGFVDLDSPQTLTNKTIDGDDNTIVNIPGSSVVGLTVVPVGGIVMFGGNTAPTDWRLCDGAVLSRAEYAALFAVVGTAFNRGGEGPDDFALPDLRGATPVGVGVGTSAISTPLTERFMGGRGGEEAHTTSSSELASHTHGISMNPTDVNHTHGATDINNLNHTHTFTAPAAGNHNHATVSTGTSQGTTVTQTVVRAQVDTGAPHGSPDTTFGGSHSHAGTTDGINQNHQHGTGYMAAPASAAHTHTGTTSSQGASQSFNVMQPFVGVNFIIRTGPTVGSPT
jgi:microcystin-dependent protein